MAAGHIIDTQPIREATSHGPTPAGPCVFVIFGVTGDLTKRLLIPALYDLLLDHLLPEHFAIAGFAGSSIGEPEFRELVAQNLREVIGPDVDMDSVRWLTSRLRYIGSDFENQSGWQRLQDVLIDLDRVWNTGGNYLFYMATAPEFFLPLAQRLAAGGLLNAGEKQWRRIVIEKPFGRDLHSARALNRALLALAREDQIYRIDHYLGKETVQNIMVTRFANGVFEPIWNRRYVDHVQITVAESGGVERRGRYYDHAGALRDMVPNHLAQLLAITAMEPPSSFSSAALQNEQVKVLESVPPIKPEECTACIARGQYASGIIDGAAAPGYRQEPYVAPDSRTETYVALKFAVDNWRWAGVPFYLRTGKRLPRRNTEVVLQFRGAPLALFRRGASTLPQPNSFVIGIQPEENILLEFEAKVPGPVIETSRVNMNFDYRGRFGAERRTGYETLLYDAMIGDSTLFKRADMIEAGWAIVQPILDAWADGRGGFLYEYPAGSDGPVAAVQMMELERRRWRPL